MVFPAQHGTTKDGSNVSDTAWDLLVIGGGTAGLVAAYTGASLGARTALVESHRTGGDCLWTGCVPSKALLHAAGVVHRARSASVFLAGDAPRSHLAGSVDMAAVMEHVAGSIAHIEPVDSPDALRDAGVTVITGQAVFTAPHVVRVDGHVLPFRAALLATGAAPTVPDVPGMSDSAVWTSESLWDLTHLPTRLLVLGGGPVGCEMSQAFARLGSSVTLVEQADRLLPKEDAEAADVVAATLRSEGVDIRLGHTVAKVVSDLGRSGQALLSAQPSAPRAPVRHEHVDYDAMLVAIGRTPRSDGLGLERAHIRTDTRGAVLVDVHGRTSNPRVWAAGDVTPTPHLTHLAAAEAAAAASNALLGLRRRVDPMTVPRVTYTDPEVAAVGVTTDADRLPDGARVVTRHHDHVDRAVTDRRTEGFSRLAVERGGRIVGATIVGPRAGESIAEMTLAVRSRTTLTRLADTVHAYPTYADGPWNAAIDDVRRQLARPAVQGVTRAVVAARRVGRRARSAGGRGDV